MELVEEIERLHELGRYVAVLRSTRPVNPAPLDLEQAARLSAYLKSIQSTALVLEYADDSELQGHVDAILHQAVSRDVARAELQRGDPTSVAAIAEVWPRIVSEERTESDSKGRIRTRRNWYLVLTNTGTAPAVNVRFTIEAYDEDSEPWLVDDDTVDGIEAIAPRGEIRFTVIATMGSALQVRCTVTWTDDRGEQQNIATLRLT
jgi:hypothetical protein